ncbi:MAG: radical SAM/SPASM domain-containing protein [Desulfovibrionaceae bacterium]
MPLRSKFRAACAAWDMTWAVWRNTGRVPDSHRFMVLIEPTSICNLACPLCPTGTGTLERKNKFIPLEMFDKILSLTEPAAEGYILNLFGEPTFHPHFPELLQKTSRLPTWLSTNLNIPEASALEMGKWRHLRVICSVDTIHPAEYPRYRIRGNWDTLIRNLAVLSQGVCEVHPQFLVPADHKDDTPYIEFAERFGIPARNVVIKRKMENFRLDHTDKPRPGKCHSAYLGLYFNCDGFLLPCCNNARSDLHMLHIDDVSSLDELLHHNRTERMRRQLAKDKNVYPSCGDCDGINFWSHQFPLYRRSLLNILTGGKKGSDTPDHMSF